MEQIKEAAFLYKCKNCGKVYDSGVRSSPEKMKMYFHALVLGLGEQAKKMFAFGSPPNMLEIHSCGKNEIGVAELAGFKEIHHNT